MTLNRELLTGAVLEEVVNYSNGLNTGVHTDVAAQQ